MVWPGSSTKDFYKTNKSSNIFVEEVNYTSDNIFLMAFWLEWNDTSRKGQSTPSTGFMFLSQCKRISTRAISSLKFPMCGNKSQKNDLNCPTRQERQDCVSVSDSIGENIDFQRRVESAYWLIKINSNCRSTTTSSVLSQAI